MTEEPQPKLLSVREAADRFRVSDQTIRNLFRNGQLKGIRLGVKLIRIFSDSTVTEPEPVPQRNRRKVKDWIGGGRK